MINAQWVPKLGTIQRIITRQKLADLIQETILNSNNTLQEKQKKINYEYVDTDILDSRSSGCPARGQQAKNCCLNPNWHEG